jgi:hypothetical protein
MLIYLINTADYNNKAAPQLFLSAHCLLTKLRGRARELYTLNHQPSAPSENIAPAFYPLV